MEIIHLKATKSLHKCLRQLITQEKKRMVVSVVCDSTGWIDEMGLQRFEEWPINHIKYHSWILKMSAFLASYVPSWEFTQHGVPFSPIQLSTFHWVELLKSPTQSRAHGKGPQALCRNTNKPMLTVLYKETTGTAATKTQSAIQLSKGFKQPAASVKHKHLDWDIM